MNEFTVHGTVPAPARSIISLAPSITEVLFYLGLGDAVAGVTRQCDHPEEARSKLAIGSFAAPDMTIIAGLSPDVIIGLSDLHAHLAKKIDTGRTCLILLGYHTVQGILDAMQALASLAGDSRQALGLVASLQARLDALRSRPRRERPARTLFMTMENPVIIPGLGSYQHDALDIAGAVQMSGDPRQYERVTLEEVIHFDPEVVLACGRHRDEPPCRLCPDCRADNPICRRIVEDIAGKPGWRETAAAKTGRFLPLPCHWLCRPGPRLIDGMEKIADILMNYEA